MKNMNTNWYRLRWVVLNRDNFTCQYCGRKAPDVILHVDHKKSRIDGGNDELDNLVTACASCKIGKNEESLGIPRDLSFSAARIKKSGCPPLEKSVMNYLATIPEGATGTQVSKALGYNRANVAKVLSQSLTLNKKRIGNSVYYSLLSST